MMRDFLINHKTAITIIMVLALVVFGQFVAGYAQPPQPHTSPPDLPMTAVYPSCNTESDPNSFWAIRLTVEWDDTSYYVLPDGRFVVTGSAVEFPGATLVFVSNGVNNHGSAAWVTFDGVGG